MFERELYEIKPLPNGGWTVSRSLTLWLQEFRSERIRHIRENETGVTALDNELLLILHFIPSQSLEGGTPVDLGRLSKSTSGLSPLGATGFNSRFNADGFVTYSPSARDDRSSAYLQLFRNGVVETASTNLGRVRNGKTYIASQSFEEELIAAVAGCVGLATAAELPPPYSAGISMARVKGATMATGNYGFGYDAAGGIEADTLMAPLVAVSEDATYLASTLRPTFDFFWQAAGWHGSLNYNQDGSRKKS